MWSIRFLVWKETLAELYKNLFFILGPTAVGKTSLALNLIKDLKSPSALLNADSIQVYKDFDIGSSKPDFKSHKEVSFCLFDQFEYPQTCTAGVFRQMALKEIENQIKTKDIFLVGGSGFYIQALEKGMYESPPVKESLLEDLREKEKKEGLSSLYEELKEKDPEYANSINEQDSYRIFRSLSLIRDQGRSFSDIKKEFKEQKLPWEYKKLGLFLPKPKLLKKVRERTKKMLKEGLLEEVKALLDRGLKDFAPLSSVGYKEACLCLKGEIKLKDLEEEIVQSSMKLAKKQMTWFKRDKKIKWFEPGQDLKVYKEYLLC